MSDVEFSTFVCGSTCYIPGYWPTREYALWRFSLRPNGHCIFRSCKRSSWERYRSQTAIEISLGGLMLQCHEGSITLAITGGDFLIEYQGPENIVLDSSYTAKRGAPLQFVQENLGVGHI